MRIFSSTLAVFMLAKLNFVVADVVDSFITYGIDGVTPIEFPRQEVSNHDSVSLVLRYLPKQGIRRENSTHAFMPFKQVQATYARKFWFLEGEPTDWGAMKLHFNEATSGIGLDTVITAAAKIHVLGEQDNTDGYCFDYLDQVNAAVASRTDEEKMSAKEQALLRRELLFNHTTAGNICVDLYMAQADMTHLQKLFEYAALADATTHEDDIDGLRDISMKVDKLLSKESSRSLQPTALSTSNMCYHMERTEGLTWDEAGYYIPLGKAIVAHYGEASYSPHPRMNILSGINMYKYNDETDELEHYSLISSFSNFVGEQTIISDDYNEAKCYPSTLGAFEFLGPVDGKEWPLAEGFQRPAPSDVPKDMVNYFHESIKSIPIDYDFFSQDMEEACPPEKRERIDQLARSVGYLEDTLAFTVEKHPDEWTEEEYALVYQANVVDLEFLDCAITYFRGPEPIRKTFGFDLLQTCVLTHGLFETPSDKRMEVFGARDWDDFITPYLNAYDTSESESQGADADLTSSVSAITMHLSVFVALVSFTLFGI